MSSFPRFVRRNQHTLMHQLSHQLQDLVLQAEESAATHPEGGAGTDVTGIGGSRVMSAPSTPSTPSQTPPSPRPEPPQRSVSWAVLSQAAAPATFSLDEARTPQRFYRSAPGSSTNLSVQGAQEPAPPRKTARPKAAAAPKTIFSHQGDLLLTLGDERTARVWNLQHDDQFIALPMPQDAGALSRCLFSPEDTHVAGSMLKASVVYLWDLANPETPHLLQAPGPVLDITFSPNGARLAVTCADTVAVWQRDALDEAPTLLQRGVA